MTSKQKKAVQELVTLVKNTANHLNVIRIRLEEIESDTFFGLSCEERADSEDVRLFDGGNIRLNEVVHILCEALSFYGGLLGDESLDHWEPCSTTSPTTSPTVGETRAPIGRLLDPTFPQTSGKSATSARPNRKRGGVKAC